MNDCPYCKGLQRCTNGERCQFPDEVWDEGKRVQTYLQEGSSLPWHPKAECSKCGRQIDCLACGDSGQPQQLTGGIHGDQDL